MRFLTRDETGNKHHVSRIQPDIRQVVVLEHALRRIGVLVEDTGPGDGALVPSLAGLLALGQYPQQFFPQLNVTFIVVPVLAMDILRSLWSWLWELPLKPSRRTPKWIAISIGVLLILFGILRNVPVEPFSWLAPHDLVSPP